VLPCRVTFALSEHFADVLAIDQEEEAVSYAQALAAERGAAHAEEITVCRCENGRTVCAVEPANGWTDRPRLQLIWRGAAEQPAGWPPSQAVSSSFFSHVRRMSSTSIGPVRIWIVPCTCRGGTPTS